MTGAHTAPGIALTLVLLTAVLVQATTGLFATDDIFIDGPLVRHAGDAVVSTMTAVHHRAFWAVIAAVSVHLLAHVVYSVIGSGLPLAMFSGRKRVLAVLEDTEQAGWRGLLVAVLAAALVWSALSVT